jgi:hypothetical protein
MDITISSSPFAVSAGAEDVGDVASCCAGSADVGGVEEEVSWLRQAGKRVNSKQDAARRRGGMDFIYRLN